MESGAVRTAASTAVARRAPRRSRARLSGEGAAGVAQVVGHDRAARRRRLVGPDAVDQVRRDRDSVAPALAHAAWSRSTPSGVWSQGS